MSISNALGSALSGLSASARAASVVSSNVANANTDGYGVRRLAVTSMTYGTYGGVRVVGITRDSDPVLTGQRRDAGAAQGHADTRAGYLARIETLIGTPDTPGSLSGHFDDFEARLVSAASRPDSQSRLEGVLQSAQRLAGRLNGLSDGIQSIRLEADRQIATQVETLNRSLAAIHDLNISIRSAVSRGEDALGLQDQQQALIDTISDLVPIRERRNDAGMVTLYTGDGVSLLDGRPAQFGFTPTAAITTDMTYADGDLSGLTVNGRPVTLDGSYGALQGGRLAALFEVRDSITTKAQAQLDGVAMDLAARMDDPGLDPTLGPTDPGLFTDAGARASALNETGLAARLRINAATDPAQGGAVWRLRDGIGAGAEGDAGNPALLQGRLQILQADRPTASAVFSGTSRSMSELSADFLSLTATDRHFAEADLSHASGQYATLREAELRGGVDTDGEMQRLLEIETSYAANARVVSTVEEMLDQLMRI
ncbi:MAG: flagellar hook-associated protein FlgK [Nioella sp.]|nr:flagellar hook-associated protein FlgK [Nioella sp.]